MEHAVTLFVGTFTTLLAIINPLEAIPVFLQLTEGREDSARLEVARLSCLYGMLLLIFFLVFGNLVLWIFAIPLSMVRVVGGIILMRLGFELFAPSPTGGMMPSSGKESTDKPVDVAFVPLAMPIMVGPGAIATILGMSSLVEHPGHAIIAAVVLAIVATMLVTFLSLVYARKIRSWIGPKGVDAATRIIGFFVASMGMGLVFHGIVQALQQYGVVHV
ncbi:MAG: MarC family protein [Desulfomonilaceae bacterium]